MRTSPLHATLALPVLGGLIFGCCWLRAAGPPAACAWQAVPRQHDLRKDGVAGGLDFMVRLDPETGWPRLEKEMLIGFGRHIDYTKPHATRSLSPISFGGIQAEGGKSPELSGCTQTWAGTRVVVSYEPGELFGKSGREEQREKEMAVTASRLHPGIMVQSSEALVLFAGEGKAGKLLSPYALPAHWAARTDAGIQICGRDSLDELCLASLGKNWLLGWYGADSFFCGGTRTDLDHMGAFAPPAGAKTTWQQDMQIYWGDCPILLLFSDTLAALMAVEIDGGEAGLLVDFPDERGAVVLLPILGEFLPPVAETAKWRDGLPQAIVERCDWWAAHAAKFPVGVRETYRYDPATGTVSIIETFQFADFRPHGVPVAPVPPMLATAFLEGFPVAFSAEPADPRLVTSVGSWLGVPAVESYEMGFPGLGKYVSPRQPPAGAVPERLSRAIGSEVEKIVAAGHLAPWMKVVKNQDGWYSFAGATIHLVHANPGEVLFALAEALCFLPPDLQTSVLAYMREERAQYPPEKIPSLSGGAGARREAYPLSAGFLKKGSDDGKALAWSAVNWIDHNRENNFYVRQNMIPGVSLYYLAAYYCSVQGDGLRDAWDDIRQARAPWLENSDWATGSARQWPGNLVQGDKYGRIFRDAWYGVGGVSDVNNAFAAALGQVRLARMLPDAAEEQHAWGLFARTAALRFAAGKMTGHLYRRGLLSSPPGQESPAEDLRLVQILDETGMSLDWQDGSYWTEGLIMLRDAVPELGAFSNDWLKPETLAYFGNFIRYNPDWYLAYSTTDIHTESGAIDPRDAWQAFMAHAWILDSTPERLEKFLDLPWHPRGDLYYLHKLVEIARAYAGKSGDE